MYYSLRKNCNIGNVPDRHNCNTVSNNSCPPKLLDSTVFVCPKCTNIFAKRSDYEKHGDEDSCLCVDKLNVLKVVNLKGLLIQLPEVRLQQLDMKTLQPDVPPPSPRVHQKKIRKQTSSKTNDEVPFECHICKKTFEVKRNLARHIKSTHDNRRRFKCTICQQKFKIKKGLDLHVEFIHKNRHSFKCEICQKKFNLKRGLNNHINYFHKNRNSFSCNLCPRLFNLKSNLDFHILEAHTDLHRFHCNYCDYKSNRKLRFLGHITNCSYNNTKSKNGNSNNDKKSKYTEKFNGRCLICRIFCSSIPTLIKHVKTHSDVDLRKGFSNNDTSKTKDSSEKVKLQTDGNSLTKNGSRTRKNYVEENAEGKGDTKLTKAIPAFKENFGNYSESDHSSCKARKVENSPQENGHGERKSTQKIPEGFKNETITVCSSGVSNDSSAEYSNEKITALARALEIFNHKRCAEEDLTKYQCKLCYLTCLNALALDNHMKRHE